MKSRAIPICHVQLITATSPQVAVASGGVCPAGYICPPGTMYPQQHPCPVGTWSSIVGAQNLSSCWPCPPGLYCNRTGLSQPSGTCNIGMVLIIWYNKWGETVESMCFSL